MKSQQYTEKSNFNFLVKIKYQRSQFIKTCQNIKLVHQEIKKSRFHFEKSKFLNLEIFLSVWNFMFFHNFEQNFHHDAIWFKRNSQHESCRSTWNLQLFFTQLLPKMLGSQVMNLWIGVHEFCKLYQPWALDLFFLCKHFSQISSNLYQLFAASKQASTSMLV